jgi:hypothetical protein
MDRNMSRESELIASLSEDEQLHIVELLGQGFDILWSPSGHPVLFANLQLVNAIAAGMRPGPDQEVFKIDPEGPFTASNLRLGTHGERMQSVRPWASSGFKGVRKSRCKFKVERPKIAGQGDANLGTYETAEQAARVYDTWVHLRDPSFTQP